MIEDAAHALPASYRGKRVGTISELTAFSFYATKTLSTGEGGMLTTDNDEYAERASVMRLHGIGGDAWKRYSRTGSWYYEVQDAGYKINLPDLLSALGRAQLKSATCSSNAAREISTYYNQQFQDIAALELPPGDSEDVEHAWHLYILRLRPEVLALNRDEFIQELKALGIGTSVHFIPLHRHPYWAKQYGHKPQDFPNAEDAFARCLSLPIYPDMTEGDMRRVAQAVERVVTNNLRQAQLCEADEGYNTSTSMPLGATETATPDWISPWCTSKYKRLFDIGVSFSLLVLVSPLMLGIALWCG